MKKTKQEVSQMKRTFAVLTVLAVLSLGTFAFAHGSGYGYGGHMGYGGGYMMGGPGMMGPGYGGHMGYGPGYGGAYDKDTQKFLDETADLRKELHDKRFEYMEAVRAGDEKKAEQLAAELDKLAETLYDKAPRTTARGYGRGPGAGFGCR